jgi:serine/threonine protein kinase
VNAEKQKLRHPNILRVFSTGHKVLRKEGKTLGQPRYVVSEFCPNGDLYNFVVRANGLPEDIAIFLFKKIVEGAIFMHDKGIAHRDLKPENILLTKTCVPKIGDFGLIKKTSSLHLERLQTKCGTMGFMAPEICSKAFYNGDKTDTFALGVILFQLITCKMPFKQAGDIYHRMLDKNNPNYLSKTRTENINPSVLKIVREMTAIDARKRPQLR